MGIDNSVICVDIPKRLFIPAGPKELGVDVFTDRETKNVNTKNVNTIARRAVSYAQLNNLDTIILDTAGRLQIDNDLVKELIDVLPVTPH